VRQRAAKGEAVAPQPPKLFRTFRYGKKGNNLVPSFYIWGATSAPISAVKEAGTSKPWVSFGSSPRRHRVTIVKKGGTSWAELDTRCCWHVCVEAPASLGESILHAAHRRSRTRLPSRARMQMAPCR